MNDSVTTDSEFIHELSMGGSLENSGVFPTYFIFLDLPKHIEFRSQNLPILSEGLEMDFDLTIRNPRDVRKSKRISGIHVISRCLLKFGGKHSGIAQYLEWKSIR
jgi:hypothetical protein